MFQYTLKIFYYVNCINMGKEKRMKVLSFLDASHPMKYLLTLPIKYEYIKKSFYNAQNNLSQLRR